MKLIKSWILPVIISLGLFISLRPAFAQIVEGQPSLSNYLKTNNVEVGSEAVEGYTQIYYIFDGQKKFITQGAVNSNIPVTDGEQIVYRQSLGGGDQLFLYNLLTQQLIQITTSDNNTNPKIKGKNIVWEGLVDGNWQIFFYDGMKVLQLTSGDMSINADIDGDFIIYARRDITVKFIL
jgi:beta propeller repeat protein